MVLHGKLGDIKQITVCRADIKVNFPLKYSSPLKGEMSRSDRGVTQVCTKLVNQVRSFRLNPSVGCAATSPFRQCRQLKEMKKKDAQKRGKIIVQNAN